MISFIILSTFFILSLSGIRRVLTNSYNETFLNKYTTNSLKGIAILGILSCHILSDLNLYDKVVYGMVAYVCYLITTILAPLCVSFFLFLSGYGCLLSLKNKSETTWKWLYQKVFRLFITATIVLCIQYLFVYIFNYRDLFIDKFSFIMDVLTMTLPPRSSWYPKVQVLAYISLFLSYITIRKYNKNLFLLFLSIFWLIYVMFCIYINKNWFWYDSAMAFPLGCLFAEYKDKIIYIFSKNTFLIGMIMSVLTVVLFISTFYTGVLSVLILCLVANIAVSVLSLKISLKSKILEFLGKYSWEIYLCHFACITIIKRMDILTPYNIVLIVLITIIMSPLLFKTGKYLTGKNFKFS